MKYKLKKVCDFYTGTGFPVAYQGNNAGEMPFYKVGDIASNVAKGYTVLQECNNYISRKEAAELHGTIVPPDTVVFAKIGEALKLNRRAVTACNCLIDNNAMGIRPGRLVNSEYFYYFMLQLKMETLAESTTVPSVRKSRIEEVEIEIPVESEQQKIVEVLNGVSKIIISRKKQLIELDSLVKARFVEMFGDLAFGDLISTNKHKIGELADVTKLAGFEFTEYIHYQDSGEIIMLRGLNCKRGKLVLDNVKYIDRETSLKLPRSRLQKGDILMTYAGTIGEVALVDEDDKYHLAPNVAKISIIDKNVIDPVFLVHLFMYTNNYIMSFASQVAQASINMQKIRDFEYFIPDIASQRKFVIFSRQVDKQKTVVQKALDEAQMLFDSLMQEYFG